MTYPADITVHESEHFETHYLSVFLCSEFRKFSRFS